MVITLRFIIQIPPLFLWNSCQSSSSFLKEWDNTRRTQLPQRRNKHSPSSCLTETMSSIVPQAAQRQWCSVPSCLWNRRAAGLQHKAGDLRWYLCHSMLPLCPQRNSHKWGVDELAREVVRPVVLKHREIYGSISKWLSANQLSFQSLESLFPCSTPVTPPSSELWFPGPQVWVIAMRTLPLRL